MSSKATHLRQPVGHFPGPNFDLYTMSAIASEYSKQGDTPAARLSKLGCGSNARQRYTSTKTSAKEDPDVQPSIFRKPKYIEDGDPLKDEEKLLRGLPIVEPGDEALNTIRKVPSDQALLPLRWGSSRRTTGRSKSGLQILVPSSNTSTSMFLGGAMTGKSIIYAYNSSSSSSSGKTTGSFGAVGDHLTSTRSAILPGDRNPSTELKPSIMSANARNRSPLADLVLTSAPDEEPYPLLALGYVGPWKQPFTPQLVKPSNLGTLIQRRRSLTDLKEVPKTRGSLVSAESGAAKPQVAANMKAPRPDDFPNVGLDDPIRPHGLSSDDAKDPPVWSRRGLPFEANRRVRSGLHVPVGNPEYNLDPDTFSLPFGSKVFIMKSTNIYNLRASVEHGVWSSTKGANRVLQNAWEARKPGEKIVFIFSITHSHRYSGKYCGLAEMSGPFDPQREANIWTEGLQGNEGVIPTRWIVAKDVEFSVFDDLKYNDKPVSQLRHCNTVPGEAGRNLIQRYFEAEHSATAVIHPKTELAPSTPDRRDRRSNLQGASNPGRQVAGRLQSRRNAPSPSLRKSAPAYWGAYSGNAALNHRNPPAQLHYGSVASSREDPASYPMYGHGSSSTWY